jgi:hypothetical protein
MHTCQFEEKNAVQMHMSRDESAEMVNTSYAVVSRIRSAVNRSHAHIGTTGQ